MRGSQEKLSGARPEFIPLTAGRLRTDQSIFFLRPLPPSPGALAFHLPVVQDGIISKAK